MTTNSFDDLWVKQKQPNHLAGRLEKLAGAGAKVPQTLAKRLDRQNQLTQLAKKLLSNLLAEEVLSQLNVVYVGESSVTIALPNMTAVNYVRYLQEQCLQTLHSCPEFLPFTQLKVIPSTKRQARKIMPQKPQSLSQSTKNNITQTANLVITNPKLRDALLNLAQDCGNTPPIK